MGIVWQQLQFSRLVLNPNNEVTSQEIIIHGTRATTQGSSSMHKHFRRKPISFKDNHQDSDILIHSTAKFCFIPSVTKISSKFCSEVFFFCLQLYTHCKTILYHMILNEINIKMNHTINTLTLILHIIYLDHNRHNCLVNNLVS